MSATQTGVKQALLSSPLCLQELRCPFTLTHKTFPVTLTPAYSLPQMSCLCFLNDACDNLITQPEVKN